MGKITFSIPRPLVALLCNGIKINNFVETTHEYNDETTQWASSLFDKVYVLGTKAKNNKNISVQEGDSEKLLSDLLNADLKGDSIFYLNSHSEKYSRLKEELSVLKKIEQPIIFINNAHYLYANTPHVAQENYPTLDQVFALIKEFFPKSTITIIDGVIVCVPEELSGVISSFWAKTYEERFFVADEAPKQRSFFERAVSKSKRILNQKKHKVGESVAYDIHNDWFDGQVQQFNQTHKWLGECGFKSIIDVGGNVGQFGKKIRTFYPDAKLYSFEPIPFVYDVLAENFKDDKNFKGFMCGLGDTNGTAKFYQNDFSDSSSMLKIGETHVKNFPYTKNETIIDIEVKKLDDCLNINEIEKPYLLKLDVQGFEDKVIDGGLEIVKNADTIITESSYKELYEDQVLFDVIYDKLIALGFRFAGNLEQMDSAFTGEPLQGDAIFKKVK